MTSLRMSPRRWARLPIEIAARELDAKMLLAGVLARDGWGVIVGQEAQVRDVRLLGPSAYYEKSVAPGMAKPYARAIGEGSLITANCEEGLVYLDRPTYVRRKIDRANLASCTSFFCWGRSQADDLIESFGTNQRNLVVSGNTRIDLLRPEMRSFYDPLVSELRKRHGRFVLFNTKFGRYNAFMGRDRFYAMAKGSWALIRNADEDAAFRRTVEHQEKTFGHTISLITSLAERHPDLTIIVRPHPSEDWSTYLDRFGRYDNVRVATTGSAIEWILAAAMMVHSDCTTGVEAYALGKPSISYEPVPAIDQHIDLPRQLSARCPTEEMALEAIARSLSGQPLVSEAAVADMKAIADNHMVNLSGRPAAVAISDRFSQFDLPLLETPFEAVSDQAVAGPGGIPDAVADHQGDPRQRDARVQKFPSRSPDSMAELLRRLGRNIQGVEELRVAGLGKNLFCVYDPTL